MKKFTTGVAIILLLLTMQFSFGQVIISQYYEGASNDKWIEIANIGPTTIDLGSPQLYLCLYSNAAADDPANYSPTSNYALAGTMNAGDVLLFKNSSAVNPTYASGTSTGVCNFNGDDLVIISTSNGASAWADRTDVVGDGSTWGANTSFYRMATILGGNLTFTLAEWTQVAYLDVNTAPSSASEYLGTHVYNAGGGNIPPSIVNVATTPAIDITSSDAVSISADVTDSDGTITGVELHWGTASGSLGTTIAMSNTGGDTYTTDTDIPAQTDGTTVYYEIVATDDEPESTTAGEFSYTVNDPATTALPYIETFDAGFGDCYTYNVAGIKTWYYFSGGQQVSANGYGGDNPEEDWLILPAIDFDSYSNEVMTFTTYARFGTNDDNNYLKLFYSTDYPGLGDPTDGYTWTELAYNQPAGINSSFEVSAPSGSIDLAGISGSMVYIAFKYYSTDSPTRWSVDDIKIGVTMGWCNLQFVSQSNMPTWFNADVYAQGWLDGVTNTGSPGVGIECWIGYSLVNEDPSISTSFTYIPASFLGDVGNNDEFFGKLGADVPMAPGVYYIVSRWSYLGGPYKYGDYGGVWNNNSFELTINPSAAASTWTGAVDQNWFDGGNWTNDVPGYNTDVTIPGGLTNYPSAFGTSLCNNLLIQSGPVGDASILGTSDLQVIGTTTVEKYISADTYHSFTPTVSGQTADLFHLGGSTGLDVYLYSHDEANNGDPNSGYFEIVDISTPLYSGSGYAVYADGANATPPVTGWTFLMEGDLNFGSFGSADNLTRTGAGAFAGFNYAGNPYPSYMDWEAGSGWTKTNINPTTWIENNGSWAQYTSPGPGINGGSRYIAPGQGFFVEVTSGFGTGTLMANDDVRTNTTTPFLKNSVSNYVKLVASGNDKTDEMVVRFEENATVQYEGEYDGIKLAAGDFDYPQIYSIAEKNLAYNALPETETVQLGFHCGVNGQYTIESDDINEIAEVWLEDTFTGIITNLAENSYTFNYATTDEVDRFILHFTALSTEEFDASANNIYAYQKNVYVHITSNNAVAQVYNMTGQLINTFNLTSGTNQFRLDQTGNYIVRVISDTEIATRKVNIQ